MKSFKQYVTGDKKPGFNRIKHYAEYYKNVSPKDFKIAIVNGKIQIDVLTTRSRGRE